MTTPETREQQPTGAAPATAEQPARAGRGRVLSRWGLSRAALLLALFLLVVGARLWMVRSYTTPLPFWDQWDAEGAAILKPWLDGSLSLGSFFAPHNEHRVALSRGLTFLLFLASGQWDAQPAMVFNALVCGLVAVLIAAVGGRLAASRETAPGLESHRLPVVAALAAAALFVLPFGWENTLGGFQSQFYFLLLFSLVALWGLGGGEPGSRRWWVGFGGAVLACFSMASGCFAAAAVLGLEVLRWVRTRGARPTRATWINVAVCLLFVVAGWLSTSVVPHHATLKVESVPAFFRAAGRYLAWPFISRPLLFLPLQLPLVWLVVAYLRGGNFLRPQRGVELVLVCGIWSWLQAGVTAFARGGQEAVPPSRYQDLLAFGALVNFFALLLIFRHAGRASADPAALAPSQPRGFLRFAAGGALALWLGLLGFGLWERTQVNVEIEIPEHAARLQAQERNVRGYVATGDFSRYLANKKLMEIPYPDPRRLAGLLRDPALRAILPANVRAPVPLVAVPGASAGEVWVPGGVAPGTRLPPPDFVPVWGSFGDAQESAQGEARLRLAAPVTMAYLRFHFAGGIGESGLTFALRDVASQRTTPFAPYRAPFDRWRADHLPAPGRGIEVVAVDASSSAWFAFSAPVEVSAVSYWTGFLLRRGGIVLGVGATAFTVAAFVSAIIGGAPPREPAV